MTKAKIIPKLSKDKTKKLVSLINSGATLVQLNAQLGFNLQSYLKRYYNVTLTQFKQLHFSTLLDLPIGTGQIVELHISKLLDETVSAINSAVVSREGTTPYDETTVWAALYGKGTVLLDTNLSKIYFINFETKEGGVVFDTEELLALVPSGAKKRDIIAELPWVYVSKELVHAALKVL